MAVNSLVRIRKNTKEEKVSLLYYDSMFFEVRTKTYLAVGSNKAPDESLKIKTKQQQYPYFPDYYGVA